MSNNIEKRTDEMILTVASNGYVLESNYNLEVFPDDIEGVPLLPRGLCDSICTIVDSVTDKGESSKYKITISIEPIL